MKKVVAVCLVMAAVGLLEGCEGVGTPTDAEAYRRECITKNDDVRGHCDQPGQSDKSRDYQPH